MFTGFILYEFVRIGTIRSQEKLGWLDNKWLLAALVFSVLLQLLVVYSPLNSYFHIVPLNIHSWVVLIGGVIVGYLSAIILTKIITKNIQD